MNTKINKSKLNLTIDIVMFVFLMAISGVGFLIKYILIPGFKRNDIYGKDVELYFWGFDRHQWGSIHLFLSFGLLFLLLLHIVFHWKQIVSTFRCLVPVKGLRIAFTVVFTIVSILFGIMPLFLQPEVQQGVSHHNNHSAYTENLVKSKLNSIPPNKSGHQQEPEVIDDKYSAKGSNNSKNTHAQDYIHERNSEIEIFGYMTLDDVAAKYNIPISELAQCLNIPEETSNVKLGKLRKQYDFRLCDLRDYIGQKK